MKLSLSRSGLQFEISVRWLVGSCSLAAVVDGARRRELMSSSPPPSDTLGKPSSAAPSTAVRRLTWFPPYVELAATPSQHSSSDPGTGRNAAPFRLLILYSLNVRRVASNITSHWRQKGKSQNMRHRPETMEVESVRKRSIAANGASTACGSPHLLFRDGAAGDPRSREGYSIWPKARPPDLTTFTIRRRRRRSQHRWRRRSNPFQWKNDIKEETISDLLVPLLSSLWWCATTAWQRLVLPSQHSFSRQITQADSDLLDIGRVQFGGSFRQIKSKWKDTLVWIRAHRRLDQLTLKLSLC